jgi:methionyl-tRNA formyltransferase
MDLRIVFMGTPDFAVGSLDKLCTNNKNIVGVVTTPDKPAGRGQKIQTSAVKDYALSKGLPVLQPEKLKDETFIEQLKALNPDLIVVVAFRMLPEIIWTMPKYGTLNVHASLLPQYRGAAPINWAIINGEKESGVTTFFIEKEIDTGNIILQDRVQISENETAGQLHDKLMETGANLLLKTVRAIEDGNCPKTPQSELIKQFKTLNPAPKIFKENCKINWNEPAQKVHNLIRGLSPYPGAWSLLTVSTGKSQVAKIYETEYNIQEHQHKPGSIITDGKTFVKVAVNNGYLNILYLQLEGKKKMPVADLLRGFQNIEQYRFS